MGKTEVKSRFEGMTLKEIFESVIINKENWSSQKQDAVDYICEKLLLLEEKNANLEIENAELKVFVEKTKITVAKIEDSCIK